jgi:hypothetical protein
MLIPLLYQKKVKAIVKTVFQWRELGSAQTNP